MSEDSISDGIPQIEPGDEDRRAFLTRSGALVALLATSCTTDGEGVRARGPANSEAVAVNRVVDLAIANGGNVSAAVGQSGVRLSAETLNTLNSLTIQDWQAAARLSQKLGRLRHLAGHNNGIAGM